MEIHLGLVFYEHRFIKIPELSNKTFVPKYLRLTAMLVYLICQIFYIEKFDLNFLAVKLNDFTHLYQNLPNFFALSLLSQVACGIISNSLAPIYHLR